MSGFLGDVVEIGTFGLIDGGDLTGENAAGASRDASRAQSQALDRSINLTRETRDLARNDLAPFRDFGASQINPLLELFDPQGQSDFLTANPLFNASLDSINKATMNNRAARGKLGSGGTLKALQNNFTTTALPFLNNQQNQLFNAINLGQSSAAGQANTALNTNNSIANMLGQQGDVRAAGIVGAQGAQQGAFNNLLNLGGQIGGGLLAMSDRRVKEDIKEVGILDNGLKVYTFKYKGDEMTHMGVMAQEVEEVNPNAAVEIDGIKHVNYAEVA